MKSIYLSAAIFAVSAFAEDKLKQVPAAITEPIIKDKIATTPPLSSENLEKSTIKMPVGTNVQDLTKHEIDFTNLFEKGVCPEGIVRKSDLDYTKLSGDWFLHRTDEPFIPDMLPKCHHCNFQVNSSGEFTATEEAQFGGHRFVMENVTGKFDGSKLQASFFDNTMQLTMQILDTDYNTYMIGYQCFDNIQFALEAGEDAEPVHMIMMGIVTRKPDETKEMLTAVEDKALKLLPFLNRENIATIEQGTAGRCEYQLPF